MKELKDAIDRTDRQEPTRIPFGGRRKRLTILNKDPEYFYYWFKDVGDDLFRARSAGYMAVSYEEAGRQVPEQIPGVETPRPGEPCRVHGGVVAGGQPFDYCAMKIKMDLHKQDLKKYAQAADEIDRGIYRPEFKDGKIVVDGHYGSFSVDVERGMT